MKFLGHLRGIVQRLRQRTGMFVLPSSPHLSREALDELDRHLIAGAWIIEYGSGGSTIYAVKRGANIISSESSRPWSIKVNRTLRKLGAKSSVVVYSDIGPTGEWGFPLDRAPTPASLAQWRKYVVAPWSEASLRRAQPKFVFVDGRFRVACAIYSFLQSGASDLVVFVDDFHDRPEYAKLLDWAHLVKTMGRAAVFVRNPEVSEGDLKAAFESSLADVN